MNDLTNFLRERLESDATWARAATGEDWRSTGEGTLANRDVDGWNASSDNAHIATFRHTWDADHAARWSPTRVLREVEAKRQILGIHRLAGYDFEGRDVGPGCYECGHSAEYSDRGGWCETVRLLALPYADHPDYREEWKP